MTSDPNSVGKAELTTLAKRTEGNTAELTTLAITMAIIMDGI
jgi:hypothetical protein